MQITPPLPALIERLIDTAADLGVTAELRVEELERHLLLAREDPAQLDAATCELGQIRRKLAAAHHLCEEVSGLLRAARDVLTHSSDAPKGAKVPPSQDAPNPLWYAPWGDAGWMLTDTLGWSMLLEQAQHRVDLERTAQETEARVRREFGQPALSVEPAQLRAEVVFPDLCFLLQRAWLDKVSEGVHGWPMPDRDQLAARWRWTADQVRAMFDDPAVMARAQEGLSRFQKMWARG